MWLEEILPRETASVLHFGFQALRVWLSGGFNDFGRRDHLHQRKRGAWVTEQFPLVLLSTWLPAIILNFSVLLPSQLISKIARNWQEVLGCNLSASFGHSCFPSFGKVSDLVGLLDRIKMLWRTSNKDIPPRARRCPSIYYYEFTVGRNIVGHFTCNPQA